MVNKYKPHVYVIPEDDADRQLANGFREHHQVKLQGIDVMPPPGGWQKVLQVFSTEYVPRLRSNAFTHVVLLVDFDGDVAARRAKFDEAIPEDLKDRVFVVGASDNPEVLRGSWMPRASLEEIGGLLADDCDGNRIGRWSHEQLGHNEVERTRLVQTVRPFLF